MKRLTRTPCCCRAATSRPSSSAGVSTGHPAWLVISPGMTGTSVHCVGRACRTIASRSGRGSPSMLNSIPGRVARYSAIWKTAVRRMWRSSARGWTVMPGAPASMQARTASRTEGSEPPRELRRVATLLTLTERRITRSSETGPDRIGDLVGPAVNLLLVLAFDHDAQQRFGAGIADQQAALPGELRFHAVHHLRDRGHRSQVRLMLDAGIDQHLRIRHQLPREIGQLAAGIRHDAQHVQRGRDTVPGKQVVGEDDMAGLLAANRDAALD